MGVDDAFGMLRVKNIPRVTPKTIILDCDTKIESKWFNWEVEKEEHRFRASYLASYEDPGTSFYIDPESSYLFILWADRNEIIKGECCATG